MDTIEIPATRLSQKGIPVYTGKMRASDLLELSAIDEWKENHLTKGYQREQFEEKADDISFYLENCPIAMVPGVLASLREEYTFSPVAGDLGLLSLPNVKRSLYLMDGQQRTGGIQRVAADYRDLLARKGDLSKDEEKKLASLKELLESYEVPVTLVDIRKVMDLIRAAAPADMKNEIKPSDAEMAYFFIVNKTQKAVNPSLKDQLAYNMVRAGIQGIPVIEREKWRAAAVPVVNALNTDDSPLEHQINLGGTRGLHRPVRLSSFVTAVDGLFRDNDVFVALPREAQIGYLKAYWNVVKKLWPKAFAEATKNQWLILKTIGVYSLNRLANQVFTWCSAKGAAQPTEQDIEPYLAPLKAIDWTKEDSPFSAFGGQKGVKAAHQKLIETLAEAGVTEARASLGTPGRRGTKKKAEQTPSMLPESGRTT